MRGRHRADLCCAVVACLVWTVDDLRRRRHREILCDLVEDDHVDRPPRVSPRAPESPESKTDGIAPRSYPHRAHKSQ